MKPIIYPNCSLFAFDRETLEFFTIDPSLVGVRILNGFYDYYLLEKNRDLLIVQAINIKKASAKMLTLLDIYNKINGTDGKKNDSIRGNH